MRSTANTGTITLPPAVAPVQPIDIVFLDGTGIGQEPAQEIARGLRGPGLAAKACQRELGKEARVVDMGVGQQHRFDPRRLEGEVTGRSGRATTVAPGTSRTPRATRLPAFSADSTTRSPFRQRRGYGAKSSCSSSRQDIGGHGRRIDAGQGKQCCAEQSMLLRAQH